MSTLFHRRAVLPICMLAFLGAATPALAGPTCTEKPRDQWLSPEQMQERIVQLGYHDVRTFKTTSGNCYEIYGFDKEDRRAEVYFNPVNGEIVREKVGR